MERDAGVHHDALRTQQDAPFGIDDDNPLWRAHQSALSEAVKKGRVRGKSSAGDVIDPWGVRFGTPALLAFGLVLAGDAAPSRLAAALAPADPAFRQAGAADMWIEPPAYTGRPPTYLLSANDTLEGRRETLAVPVGAELVARIHQGRAGAARLQYRSVSGATTPGERPEDDASEQRLTINEPGAIVLSAGGVKGVWSIDVIADTPPAIALLSAPKQTETAGLALAAAVKDDYGVARANLIVRLAPDQDRPLDAPTIGAAARQERRVITLDGAAGRSGPRLFQLDLQSDPWAGLEVTGVLEAVDGADQTAYSEDFIFTLPKRRFVNPLAQSVVEQRQRLSLAPQQWRQAETAFSGLTVRPDRFYATASDYLLMRNALWKVKNKGDALEQPGGANATIDELWPLALQLEDKRLEDARARLDAAREALRQALAEGAPQGEIERLTEALRRAMQQYLSAAAQSPSRPAASQSGARQSLDMADLDGLLDSIKDLSANGADQAAERALSELESILENLDVSGQTAEGAGQPGAQSAGGGQSAPGGAMSGDGGDGAGESLGAGDLTEAADLIRRQRALADRTFALSENGVGIPGVNPPRTGSSGSDGPSTNDPLNDSLADVRADQSGVSDTLSDVLSALTGRDALQSDGRNGLGANAARAIEDSLDGADRALRDARRDMQSAEEALAAGALDAAETAMNAAVENLRAGAGRLAEAAAAAQVAAGEAGQNGGDGVRRDPLGRAIGGALAGDGVDVPGVDDAARARAVLEELWRRLSTGERTPEEIEYLERLLERF